MLVLGWALMGTVNAALHSVQITVLDMMIGRVI